MEFFSYKPLCKHVRPPLKQTCNIKKSRRMALVITTNIDSINILLQYCFYNTIYRWWKWDVVQRTNFYFIYYIVYIL